MVAAIAVVAPSCARPAALPRETRAAEPADVLTRADVVAYERARDLVCPGRAEDGLAGLSAVTRIEPPVGRWRVPATSQLDAVEGLVAATPRSAEDHAEVLVRAADVLARAEWELVGVCLRGSPTRAPGDVRRETAAMHAMVPRLRVLRARVEAHCAVLVATHPEAAARSRCRVLALR